MKKFLEKLSDLRKRIIWPIFLGLLAMHLLALPVLHPWFFTWSGVFIGVALYWITGGFGICLCYHRLLTHRSFKTYKWFEYLLTVCGTLAWQGGPRSWVATHRIHHQHSDKPGDPHSPVQDGFAYAHHEWNFLREPGEKEIRQDVTKDLDRDPIMVLINRFFWLPQVIVAALLFVFGWYFYNIRVGVSWVVWGVGVRTTVVYHITWFINSAAHTWGYRNFDTPDNSKNLWILAPLSWGEAFHNNHHAHQTWAAHGIHWYEPDFTYYTILLLEFVGLVWDVKKPEQEKKTGSPLPQ